MARYRLFMLLGWAALLGGPLAGWLAARPAEAAVAYGGTASRWPTVAVALAPSLFAAALLLLNGALRADARRRVGGLSLAAGDRALVGASRWAGWACAAVCGVGLVGAMVFGGPLGIIGGFGLLLVLFSLVGRGRAPAAGYRANAGKPEGFRDPRRE